MKLERKFYLRDGLTVARELIGKKIITNLPEGLTSGIIIETEAYMGTVDAASHAYRGKTERTKIFYGAGGFVLHLNKKSIDKYRSLWENSFS